MKLHGLTFAQLFPGVPEYDANGPTPQLRKYCNSLIQQAERIQRSMAHDAAPDPAPRQSQKDGADPDPDLIIKCFNGRPYAEGKRLYDEYQSKKGKK